MSSGGVGGVFIDAKIDVSFRFLRSVSSSLLCFATSLSDGDRYRFLYLLIMMALCGPVGSFLIFCSSSLIFLSLSMSTCLALFMICLVVSLVGIL